MPRERADPMTLENMRTNGVRPATATCLAFGCDHQANVLVDQIADYLFVLDLGHRMRCTACGGREIETRRAWHMSKRPTEIPRPRKGLVRHAAPAPDQDSRARHGDRTYRAPGLRRLPSRSRALRQPTCRNQRPRPLTDGASPLRPSPSSSGSSKVQDIRAAKCRTASCISPKRRAEIPKLHSLRE